MSNAKQLNKEDRNLAGDELDTALLEKAWGGAQGLGQLRSQQRLNGQASHQSAESSV